MIAKEDRPFQLPLAKKLRRVAWWLIFVVLYTPIVGIAWSEKDAYDEIVKCSGTQFDPKVVEAFQRAYEKIDAVRQKYADERAQQMVG